MIVVDASIFIDLIFEYSSERTRSAEELFSLIEERGLQILEPSLFKVELAGQIARRTKKDLAPKICEEIFQGLIFINDPGLGSLAFAVALETGSRAADSFYIAATRAENAILISNDRYQVDSAQKFGIEVYNLLQDQGRIEERLINISSS